LPASSLQVCTPGYSVAFFDWTLWSAHIDWMALNGINLPLGLTGSEWVWSQIFQEFNLTTQDMVPFFAGPAFLPWNRMGNMRGWGGPLTQEWMESQRDLQKLIVARQRGLGMRPVLAAFAGFVPGAFKVHYPNATLRRAPCVSSCRLVALCFVVFRHRCCGCCGWLLWL
jgi:alpha-N-acetylglucosaminidase